MKHWPSQLFPIIILSVLAGLTFWLQSAIDLGNDKHDGKLRHDPDGIAENYVVRRFDENGLVKYRLTGPHMVHYPDDDSSELRSPTLVSYRPDAPQITVTSKFAKVTSKGEVAYLWDDVRITRAATPEQQELVARMPDLTVQTEAGFAFTNSPVEITQGQSWVTGVGAQIDNNKSTFVLQSQVKGQYIRPRSTP
ncbi:LPS export ABC transporter periplasmic protein LptC [uncultured Dechloromonas sp.]|uniref:LPS export ABC transporter periplasmic protein LptC n=1 Tax=uncultured Dechloromonas sp. TaxID=171719 RepID=UPI0025EC2102|nr:LPS export ABC transporter periplasmic protein LptC [uncultured Dechloromonas sp.]